jgi:hypothetical protein
MLGAEVVYCPFDDSDHLSLPSVAEGIQYHCIYCSRCSYHTFVRTDTTVWEYLSSKTYEQLAKHVANKYGFAIPEHGPNAT